MAELIAGRYRSEGVLGTGAMGVVHRAHDTVLDRTVALKELVAPPGLDPAEAVERFVTEARAAARLRHPAIVTVHDVLADGDRVLMAMELLEGDTLARALASVGGGLPPDAVRSVMGQVAAALAEAHGAGVVHRDLKPDNVFWLPSGRVVVCDFGLARIGAGSGTRLGTVMGTPGYLAPEQVRGDHAGPAADVFGWGALAYEMLAGTPAFGLPSEDAATLIWRVVNEDPPPLHVPDDPALASVVAWALAKDPAERPADGSVLLAALGSAVPVPARTPAAAVALPRTRRPRRIRPAVLAGAGLAALALVLAVVVALVVLGGDDDGGVRLGGQAPAADFEDSSDETTATTALSTTTTIDNPDGLARVQASLFSIGYPEDWVVERQDAPLPGAQNYLDTTIKPSIDEKHLLVRVDVIPNTRTATAEEGAAVAVAGVRGKPGYQELAYRQISVPTSSGPVPAVYWEFLLTNPDTGVTMHTVDVVFRDNRGHGFAVLTRSADRDWPTWAPVFEKVRASLVA